MIYVTLIHHTAPRQEISKCENKLHISPREVWCHHLNQETGVSASFPQQMCPPWGPWGITCYFQAEHKGSSVNGHSVINILFYFFLQQMAPQATACPSYAKTWFWFIHLLNVHREWIYFEGFCPTRNFVISPLTSQLIKETSWEPVGHKKREVNIAGSKLP